MPNSNVEFYSILRKINNLRKRAWGDSTPCGDLFAAQKALPDLIKYARYVTLEERDISILEDALEEFAWHLDEFCDCPCMEKPPRRPPVQKKKIRILSADTPEDIDEWPPLGDLFPPTE